MATAIKRTRAAGKAKSPRSVGKERDSKAGKLLRKTVKAAAKAGARSARSRARAPRSARNVMRPCLHYFGKIHQRDVAYVHEAKQNGRPVVAMFCEYTPYEMILAAGGVVVALHGEERACANTEATLPMALCPWVRSSLGHAFSGQNPLFEMADLVIADGACESKRRMQEMLSEHKPLHILDLPRGEGLDAWYHWRVEVMKLRARLEKQFNGGINDEKLNEAIKEANHERSMLKSIFHLSRETGWMLDGEELATMVPAVRCVPAHVRMLEKTNRLLHKAASNSTRRRRSGGPKVLIVGAPAGRGTARIAEAVREAGGRVIPQCLHQGLAPAVERVRTASDPLDQVAEKYLDLPSACTPLADRRLAMVETLVRHFRPDAAVVLHIEACGYGINDLDAVRKLLAGKNLPVAVLEDDPASLDADALTEQMSELLATRPRSRRRRTA